MPLCSVPQYPYYIIAVLFLKRAWLGPIETGVVTGVVSLVNYCVLNRTLYTQ